MESTDSCEDFPSEMKRPVRELHESLADLRQSLNIFNENYTKMKTSSSDPLIKAKLELTTAYAINSLFWIYLTTKGVNPHQHGIKQEITRLKGYVQKVQLIEDKQKSMKLDKDAASRFIRSALWEPNQDVDDKSKLSQTCIDQSKGTVNSVPNTSSRKPPKKKKKLNHN